MKNVLVLMIVFTLSSCCSMRQQRISLKDSTSVVVRTKTVFVPDTVFLEIPAQTAERTTMDSVSHLENEYAESDARINQDGSLFHDLRTKPQQKPIQIEKPIEYRDSIVYMNSEKIVPVEKELTKWQKTQIRGFWFATIALIFVCFRKNIINLVRKIVN